MANFDIKAIISAVDATGPAFRNVQSGLKNLSAQSQRLSGLLGGLVPVLTLGGLAAFAKNGIDAADALNDMSQRLGISVKDLASMKLAAEQSGTSLEGVGRGIQRLSRSIGEAEGGNKQMRKSLAELGVTARDPREAFFQLADAVKRIDNPSRRAALLSDVIGKSYVELVPLLNQGSEALRESARQSEGFADAMARLAPDADAFNDDLARLKTEAAGAASVLLTNMVPGLTQTSARVRELLDKDKGVQALAVAIGGLLKLPFDAFLGNIKAASTAGQRIAELREELADLEKALPKSQAGGSRSSVFFRSVFGNPKDIERQIAVTRNQIAVLEKFGKKVFKPRPTAPEPDAVGGIPSGPDTSALRAAQKEASALQKAQQALAKARAEAEAQGLEDSIEARKAALDAARTQELIDEETFLRAKAALDEEGLRNELAALQRQQAALQSAASAPGAKRSDKTNALAELATVDARIDSVGQKIRNLNVAVAGDLAAVAARAAAKDAERLLAQREFIEGLEQEAFLSDLSNDARETALLLLEAEKRGITDINRLLELQSQTRANANAKQAAEEIARQQDDLYSSVQQGVQQAFADGLNAIASGEGGVRGALKNIVDTIRNALSNAIAGQLTDQFLGALGGKQGVLNIAGSLGLGGKKDGSTPGTAIYVQDVGAASVAGEGGAAGGLLAQLKSAFDGLFSGLGSILSRLASSVSGLFSGGGGSGGLLAGIGSLFGFSSGGYTGDGGKYQPKGIVHGGEFVFSQDAVRALGVRALANLHSIASGAALPRAARWGYADGGLVDLPSAAAPTVNASTRIINHVNLDSAMADYLTTRAGERAILNIIQRNPGAVGA